MNLKILLFSTLLFSAFFSQAQLVSCRPKICMVDYNYHDDTNPSYTDLNTILANKPDILIQGTPPSFWQQWPALGGISCIPALYAPDSIQIFSYITSSYEDASGLAHNLARVDSIAAYGATGVFLDEIDSHPGTAAMSYISSIYNECLSKNLKLIINPGTSSFDTALMNMCHYIMTDEHYSGSRQSTWEEALFHDRVMVVSLGVLTDTAAANVSFGARDNGFGFSYACDLYTVIPSYLSSYLSLITKKPSTPSITAVGNTLHSSATFGNQWYNSLGIIAGDTNQNITPTMNGSYYSILTLQGCPSDTSNLFNYTTTAISGINDDHPFELFPNPANDFITIKTDRPDNKDVTVNFYNVLGEKVKSFTFKGEVKSLFIGDIGEGIFSYIILTSTKITGGKIVVRH